MKRLEDYKWRLRVARKNGKREETQEEGDHDKRNRRGRRKDKETIRETEIHCHALLKNP